MRAKLLLLVASCASLCGFLGCGDATERLYSVAGTVRFADGTALSYGTVEFVPDERGPSAIGNIQSDGSFKLTTINDADGARAGEYRVVIYQTGGALLQDKRHAHGRTISKEFGDLKSTPLRFTVKPDNDNTANLVAK